jgi:UDPglucose--hexose-1-phosphate uridylyltransferase
MPELRKDPIIGRWIIISSERSKRPTSFGPVSERKAANLCPFCPGHEENTPPEIISYRDTKTESNKPGWNLRVIPNKYPALMVEGTVENESYGLYERLNGIGAHEVIIETPIHARDIADMTEKEVNDILWVYRERMADLQNDIRLKYILIFKNHGRDAGASLEHSHSQLIATPIIPKRVAEELNGSKNYYDLNMQCIYCDIINQELDNKERVVNEIDDFLVIEPFASRSPFETWILPKSHQSCYLDMSEDEYLSLAKCLRDTLIRIKIALNDPAFNFVIHTRPVSPDAKEYYHWHIEIIPKLTNVAGFEWGSGFYINPTTPEEATVYLRKIIVEQDNIQ